MAEWVTELDLDGLDAEAVARLRVAGLATAEALAAASVHAIRESGGVPGEVADALLERARSEAGVGAASQVVRLRAPGGDSHKKRKARALALARRISNTADLARRAHIKVRKTKVDGRKSCKRQLARLATALEAIEADALTAGVSKTYAAEVTAVLEETEDHLSSIVDRKRDVKEHHVRRLKREMRHARRRLEALLGTPTSDADERAANA